MTDDFITTSGQRTPPAIPTQPPKPSSVFVGPHGIRAGWRLLIFASIVFLLFVVAGAVVRLLHISPAIFAGGSAAGQLTPLGLGTSQVITLLFVVIASLIMARIEHRKFSDYGMPLRFALRKSFWTGTFWGFVAISGTLLTIFALHGFRISGLAIHGTTIVTSTVAWSITFLIVGLSEEFTFRGYPQFTLTTGIGFWPAAFTLSGGFALAHVGNPGESVYGVMSVIIFGLLFCLALRRTGNLWWAIGFHMGWDWGQTFFYGVHDSGLLPSHNLLGSEFFGPKWLTGGTVGPEASIFTPIALGIVALLFSLRYREVR